MRRYVGPGVLYAVVLTGACKSNDGGNAGGETTGLTTGETGETGTETGDDTATDEETDDTGDTGTGKDDMGGDTGCPVGELGCECFPGDGQEDPSCAGALICVDGTCEPEPECQNGEVEPGEQCDDGNDVDNDGCNADCSHSSAEQWMRTFDGGEADDEARDVFVDAGGNVYVTGYVSTADTGTDVLVLKYDTDGQLLWSIQWDGAASGDDVGNGIVATADDVYVTGQARTGGQAAQSLLLLRLAALDGAVVWVQLVEGDKINGNDEGGDIGLDGDGDLYVAGTLDQDTTNRDIWVGKYDPDGNQQWATFFAGEQNQTDRGLALALDAADNVLVSGRIFGQAGAQDVFVAKLGNNIGNELWALSEDISSTDDGWGVSAALDGRIFVSGAVAHGQSGDDGWTRKYTPAGDEVWTHEPTRAGDDEYRRVAVDSDGAAIVVGWFAGELGTDGWIRKLDADGEQVWIHTFSGPEGGDDQAWGADLTADDEPVVAGSFSDEGALDIWVMKLAP